MLLDPREPDTWVHNYGHQNQTLQLNEINLRIAMIYARVLPMRS